MQIDWLSGFIRPTAIDPGVPLYDTGKVLVLKPGGELDHEHSGHASLAGSFDNRLMIRTPDLQSLYISGNPTKYFQGHNLFGPTDVCGLFFRTGIEVRENLGLFPGPATWNSLKFSGPELTRIDITRSYRFPTAQDARSWLRNNASQARTRHGAPSLSREGTLTFGAGSEYWRFVVYHKLDELESRKKGHRIPDNVPNRAELQNWASGVVRFELRLFSKEMHRLMFNPRRLVTRADLLTLWEQYFGKIEFNRNVEAMKPDMIEHQLRGPLQAAVHVWRTGGDLRAMYSRPTFYRYRREILSVCGIDIATPPPPDIGLTDETPSAELHPAGWDPEPLEANPDYSNIRSLYPEHAPELSKVEVLKRLQRA
jgi:hypothetical protein